MSTDPTTPGGTRDDAGNRPARSFTRRWVGVILVCLITIGVAAVVGSSQGPRLRSVTYSATDLVTKSGQRVILTMNQAVQPVTTGNVHVTPAVSHTVTTSGNTVGVQFAGPLAYDRKYTITITGLRAPGQNAVATVAAQLTTGTTSVLSLVHGLDDAPDQIVSRPLNGAGNKVVYQGKSITTFARVARALVVVRQNANGASEIEIVAVNAVGPNTTQVEKISLPTSQGTVTALHVADDGASFGFVYADTTTGTSRNTGLYVVDIAGTHVPLPVGPSGRIQKKPNAIPLPVSQWAYVPRTERALVRTADNSLLLIDPSDAVAPVRLGSALYLHGFVGAGTSVVIENGQGVRLLDLTNGHTTSLPEPAAARTAEYLGRIAALTSNTYLRVVGSIGSDGTVASRIVRVGGTHGATLPVPVPNASSITAVCPSPNGENAAVLTRHGDDALILIVDTISGNVEASVAGDNINWCQALPSGPDDS